MTYRIQTATVSEDGKLGRWTYGGLSFYASKWDAEECAKNLRRSGGWSTTATRVVRSGSRRISNSGRWSVAS